jgi:hypothetical protein
MYTTIWGIVEMQAIDNMLAGGLLNGILNSSLRRTSKRSAVFFALSELANKPSSVLILQ